MYFTHGKVTLHYEIYGNGYPLIMLHGNGEDITIFSKAIEKLESTFTIYAIDTHADMARAPLSMSITIAIWLMISMLSSQSLE